ncbi:helix-turn-helix domain-containing protein [Leuconostoc citreum]|uniref:helix-turn-helix domain-containing protein n=1 Tax=Leuconostoc citreum TaxID=33964 RepID=UPI002182461B|nr:helix-turn-helix transcriptional regulator [Leuconostoc citreum]MCS8587449.1 XRE family transcriptional regulator [Leuconostoc citreum]MCS8599764.1 XRE family transcriptional regulator [Leuconostoc citreum]
MIEISNMVLLELKRKRGEKNISVTKLSAQTGISRWTLADILTGKKNIVKKATFDKLNNWLQEEKK